MGRFTNGLLVGIGISLLFAPRTGEETRHLLAERFKPLRGIPAEEEELKPATQGTAVQKDTQSPTTNTATSTTTTETIGLYI